MSDRIVAMERSLAEAHREIGRLREAAEESERLRLTSDAMWQAAAAELLRSFGERPVTLPGAPRLHTDPIQPPSPADFVARASAALTALEDKINGWWMPQGGAE